MGRHLQTGTAIVGRAEAETQAATRAARSTAGNLLVQNSSIASSAPTSAATTHRTVEKWHKHVQLMMAGETMAGHMTNVRPVKATTLDLNGILSNARAFADPASQETRQPAFLGAGSDFSGPFAATEADRQIIGAFSLCLVERHYRGIDLRRP